MQEFQLNLNKAECFVQDFISIKHNSVYLYQNQQEKEDDLLDLSYYVKNIKNSFDTFCKILKDLWNEFDLKSSIVILIIFFWSKNKIKLIFFLLKVNLKYLFLNL